MKKQQKTFHRKLWSISASSMRLQIAVDVADTARILEIASDINDVIDIFEVGTPIIMSEGMTPVRELKKNFPDLCVLADTKIVDGGRIEAEDVCKAGADILTVLAVSDNATIEEVVEVAHENDRKVMADLICVRNIEDRAAELLTMGVDYIGVHTGVDMQKSGRTPLGDLERLTKVIDPVLISVAGGIKYDTVNDYVALKPGIIIAGSALYNAADIRNAVIRMKEHFNYEH